MSVVTCRDATRERAPPAPKRESETREKGGGRERPRHISHMRRPVLGPLRRSVTTLGSATRSPSLRVRVHMEKKKLSHFLCVATPRECCPLR